MRAVHTLPVQSDAAINQSSRISSRASRQEHQDLEKETHHIPVDRNGMSFMIKFGFGVVCFKVILHPC